jgi:hypothetical protein
MQKLQKFRQLIRHGHGSNPMNTEGAELRNQHGQHLRDSIAYVVWLGRQLMTGSSQAANNRRKGQRYGIRAPLTVIIGKRRIPGFTRDLSNQGVFFHLDLKGHAMLNGDFDFLVELPPDITLSTSCLVRCQGRVVRTENLLGQLTGIAAKILNYSMQSATSAST